MNKSKLKSCLIISAVIFITACSRDKKYMEEGVSAQDQKHYQEAVNMFEFVLTRYPNSRFSEEARNRKTACEAVLSEARNLIQEGDKLVADGKNEDALSMFIKAAELDPLSQMARQKIFDTDKDVDRLLLAQAATAFRKRDKKTLNKLKLMLGKQEYAWELLMHARSAEGKTFADQWGAPPKREFFTFNKRPAGDYEIRFAAAIQIKGAPALPFEGVYYVDVNEDKVSTWSGEILVWYGR